MRRLGAWPKWELAHRTAEPVLKHDNLLHKTVKIIVIIIRILIMVSNRNRNSDSNKKIVIVPMITCGHGPPGQKGGVLTLTASLLILKRASPLHRKQLRGAPSFGRVSRSFELQSKLLKGGYVGDSIGDYHRRVMYRRVIKGE